MNRLDGSPNPWIFLRHCRALVVAYLLYMMIRKRKGERSGIAGREIEL